MWYSARILGRDYPLPMTSRRYSLIIANRDTGLMRRLTLRVDALVCVALVTLVAGGALGISSLMMSAAGFDELKFDNARLALEKDSYDVAADELSKEMATLEHTIAELASRADMDPSIVESMEKLPQSGRARAVVETDGSTPPLHTFARLQGLLVSLGDELGRVRRGVAYREALAAATPVIWPADGWISGGYGYRADPFTGERDFHPAVDISTAKGQPVYATAAGRVLSAARNGAYGKLVEIDHGFGLTTRYGHLSEYAAAVGETVHRGDVIGYVGATGRATGYHVHYEVWSDDRIVNPMRLLARPRHVSAN